MCCEFQILAPKGYGKDVRSQLLASAALNTENSTVGSVSPGGRWLSVRNSSSQQILEVPISPKKVDFKLPVPPKVSRSAKDELLPGMT